MKVEALVNSSAGPVPPVERIYTLDVIRGFALLGILIMNMPYFGMSFFAETDGTHLWNAWWDRGAGTVRDVLFSGKFNSMFSMLFAIGFTIQLERFERRDAEHATSLYLRRIGWLFVFGLIHMCVFWTGDVLHIYALMGLILLALRRVPEKVLWGLFAACLLYPVVVTIIRLLTTTPADIGQMVSVLKTWEETNNVAYGQGSFLDAAREHTRETLFIYSNPSTLRYMLGFYIQILMTMLLGLILGRRHFFQHSAQWLPLIKRLQWWFLGAGLVTGVVFGLWEATTTTPNAPSVMRAVSSFCYYLCRVLIMAFYVSLILRAVHSARWRDRLTPMAVAGRMPLTNYMMQTLISTALFYGWGFGLWGKVGPALNLVMAVVIFFGVQVPLSLFWMRRFSYGPMEYFWRVLVYGRTQLRSREAASAA